MKTIRNLTVIALLLVGRAFASDFPVAKAPVSSDGKSIVTIEGDKPASLPDWLSGIYLNEEDLILVGNMQKLPFENMRFDLKGFNRYGFLLKQTSSSSVQKADKQYWVDNLTLSQYPIALLFQNTELKIPDDFNVISWLEVSYTEQKMVRRTVAPSEQK